VGPPVARCRAPVRRGILLTAPSLESHCREHQRRGYFAGLGCQPLRPPIRSRSLS
jgi:hypothetical protein